jgi:hypothetical protein
MPMMVKPEPRQEPEDRRRRRRYPVGLPVTVQIPGLGESLLAELTDVSTGGCFLRGPEIALYCRLGERLTFGFVLEGGESGVVTGRVVRRPPGEGLGVAIETWNRPFEELLADLADHGFDGLGAYDR